MSIDVEHLSFSYGSHHVLRDLSFRIPDNTLVNVLGPNGVGKSTCSDASCASTTAGRAASA
mgnify:CR=1 FL=1